jgi:ribosomal protein S4E
MEKYISIKEAKYIDGYRIYLKFNDGKEKTLDFKNFILSSQHSEIKKYKNKDLFQNFNFEYGEIEWNDYDLVFSVYHLYQRSIV